MPAARPQNKEQKVISWVFPPEREGQKAPAKQQGQSFFVFTPSRSKNAFCSKQHLFPMEQLCYNEVQ